MKNFLLTLIVGLVLSAQAFAFNSAPSGDPVLGFRDVEYVTVSLATATGYNDALSAGHALFYEDGAGGLDGLYVVSRNYSGTYNTALASKLSACIVPKDYATGDAAVFSCINRGVTSALYTVATGNAIAVGSYLCIDNLASARGKLVGCGSGITSPFIALEAKAENTSGTIKVRVVSP